MARRLPSWLIHTWRWLNRHDSASALMVALIALGVYGATLAPGLTIAHDGADGGDLIAAAWTGGVPHPTGYPTYVLLAHLFTRLPVASVAYRANFLSAVCASAAVGFIYRVVRLAQRGAGLEPDPPSRSDLSPFEGWVIAVAAALSLAASTLLWSQAVIAEVYALHALFSALLLWCCAEWSALPGNGWLWAAGLFAGLGMGNHLTLAGVAVACAVWLLPHWRRWLRARTLVPAGGLALLGLGVYAYLPLAAQSSPPVNWGNPQTWRWFWWLVSGAQYRPFVFGLEWTYWPGRLYRWAALLGSQFGWWGLVLALVGLGRLWRQRRSLAVATLVLGAVLGVYAFGYRPGDSYIYLLPVFLGMATWWAEGGATLLTFVDRTQHRLTGHQIRRLALLVLALLPVLSWVVHWRATDLSQDRSAQTYLAVVLDEQAVEPGALLVTRSDRPTFILWYGQYVEGRRPSLPVINGPLLAFPWYRNQVRQRHPELLLPPEPDTPKIPVRDLMLRNLPLRPVYATDPSDEWRQWFDFVPVDLSSLELEGLELIWRVRIKGTADAPLAREASAVRVPGAQARVRQRPYSRATLPSAERWDLSTRD